MFGRVANENMTLLHYMKCEMFQEVAGKKPVKNSDTALKKLVSRQITFQEIKN